MGSWGSDAKDVEPLGFGVGVGVVLVGMGVGVVLRGRSEPVGLTALILWVLKLLAAMVAAAWTDLSDRSAGRGREWASFGKLRRAPVPRNARAAAIGTRPFHKTKNSH